MTEYEVKPLWSRSQVDPNYLVESILLWHHNQCAAHIDCYLLNSPGRAQRARGPVDCLFKQGQYTHTTHTHTQIKAVYGIADEA